MREEEYKALRRDYGLCVKCLKKEKYSHADVVKRIDENKGYEQDNLISLCNECNNKKTEPKKKDKNGTINNMQQM